MGQYKKQYDNQRNSQPPPPAKKHEENHVTHNGAEHGEYVTKPKDKDGKLDTKNVRSGLFVKAWNYTKKAGMIVFTAFEKSQEWEEKNGKKQWYTNAKGEARIMLMFEVFYKDSGVKTLEIASFNPDTGKAFLAQSGFIISTRVVKEHGDKGYCGRIRK